MAIKNQPKRGKTLGNVQDMKRFSKSRMQREMMLENNAKNLKSETQVRVAEPKTHVCVAKEKYQFKGTPKNVYSATLKNHSSQQNGYDVLSKGQLVTVEDFGGDQPIRVTATDGRQGITCLDNIKPLFS